MFIGANTNMVKIKLFASAVHVIIRNQYCTKYEEENYKILKKAMKNWYIGAVCAWQSGYILYQSMLVYVIVCSMQTELMK